MDFTRAAESAGRGLPSPGNRAVPTINDASVAYATTAQNMLSDLDPKQLIIRQGIQLLSIDPHKSAERHFLTADTGS
jgi:hypothetical protein